MKKVFVVLCVSALLAACGGSSKSGSADSTATTGGGADSAASASAATTSSAPGAKLIAANDCNTCHKIDTKVIGPAFQDVANKYPATDASIDTLANKVIKGGKGNWGDIPMAAHPTLALADAKEMVKYILSLKK
ncbi:c-type cytochrome [Mucilaginibacter sp. X4EP1]|uniref:c-type cytochrome n=1 Tax=Mucilaginibacter sp. X4EP1 TaxID=2723092 RepID=UPI0021688C6D|nr:c-type cytochrome [Mucilaginibacter sp. X4EP1]MCS3813182.1 cytochrome c [Mucilaginibacter sp. X4EP1]